MAYVPRYLLSEAAIGALRVDMVAKHFDTETNITTNVKLYRETPNGILLPRAYVKDNIPAVWRASVARVTLPSTSPGVWRKDTITPRDADQSDFMHKVSALVRAGLNGQIIDDQIHASTGTGKTAAMLKALCDNDITNGLVIVHRNHLKEGWLGSVELKKGLRFFFGEEWVERNVGIIQQDICEWQKPIVIAMAPTFCSRTFPQHVYDKFGVIFIDEDHRIATPVLQQVLPMFRAAVRIGATATLKKGSMAKVTTYHLGGPSVVSKQKPVQARVIRIINKQEVRFYKWNGPANELENAKACDNDKTLTSMAANLADRNELIADIIYQRGYSLGRYGLVLADRVEHLVKIRQMVVDRGADPELCGLYVGEHLTETYKLTGKVWAYDNEGNVVAKHFRGLEPFETRGKAESYVNKASKQLGDVRQPIYREYSVKRFKYKLTAEDRARIETKCQFVFATYGIFSDGTDISRLNWGMDIAYRKDVTQALGRILRIHPDKPIPVWYSMEDEFHQYVTMFGEKPIRYIYGTPIRLAQQRIASYNQQNAIISVIGNPRDALEKANST